MNRLIMGCGFLGLPLARLWAQAQGPVPSSATSDAANGSGVSDLPKSEVFGSTRSEKTARNFSAAGITPVVCDVTDLKSLESALAPLPPVDTVVFAIGMDRSRYDDVRDVYVRGLERFFDAIGDRFDHFIYVSSTGVFGDFDGAWIDESAPTNPARDSGKACLEAEQLIARRTDHWTVLRMAGLYGGDRVPTQAVIEKRDWSRLSPEGYLNLIHQTDAVAAIDAAARLKPMGEIIHCSDGHPPIRKDYYQFIADQFNLGAIPWPDNATVDPSSRSANSKRVGNAKMLDLLQLKLKHPDYRSGLAQ